MSKFVKKVKVIGVMKKQKDKAKERKSESKESESDFEKMKT